MAAFRETLFIQMTIMQNDTYTFSLNKRLSLSAVTSVFEKKGGERVFYNYF